MQKVDQFELVVFEGQKYKLHIDNFLLDQLTLERCTNVYHEMYHEERKTFNFKLI